MQYDDDDEEEEEEELEEEEEGVGVNNSGYSDSDDEMALSRTNKQSKIIEMLREEDDDEDFDTLYNLTIKDPTEPPSSEPQIMLPGTHVRVGSEQKVKESFSAVGGHWQEIMSPCCKKVGMVIRNMDNPELVYVKFHVNRRVNGVWEGWDIQSAAFTLPKRALDVVFPPCSRNGSRKLSLSHHSHHAETSSQGSCSFSQGRGHTSASLPAHVLEQFTGDLLSTASRRLKSESVDHLDPPFANASFSSIASAASSISDRSPPCSPSARCKVKRNSLRKCGEEEPEIEDEGEKLTQVEKEEIEREQNVKAAMKAQREQEQQRLIRQQEVEQQAQQHATQTLQQENQQLHAKLDRLQHHLQQQMSQTPLPEDDEEEDDDDEEEDEESSPAKPFFHDDASTEGDAKISTVKNLTLEGEGAVVETEKEEAPNGER